MLVKSFFRATEVWTPTADRQHLDLTSGIYHDMPYFEGISRGMRLAHDEGLPGKAWTSGHPIVLKDLANSYFRRGDAAMSDGLSCAIAVPIRGPGGPTSVIIFFLGDNRYQRGAVEIWNAPEGAAEMSLHDGYFGRADQFDKASRDTTFARGAGLPGKTWDSRLPVIVAEVASSDTFERRASAERFTIRRAVGIPCSFGDEGDWVLTFLSVRSSPIAQRFELWLPDEATGAFKFADGYCETDPEFKDRRIGISVPLQTGLLADLRNTAIPLLCADTSKIDDPITRSASEAGLQNMVALPVFGAGKLNAVLAWFA